MKDSFWKKVLLSVLGVATIFFLLHQITAWIRTDFLWRSYVVQSGSMEPSIMTGDLIVLKKEETYQKNDVVTFTQENRTITHRVMEVSKKIPRSFITKGDANQNSDTEVVPEEKVVGRVVQVIPKMGYLVRFLKTPLGFVLCVVLPGALIVYAELASLARKPEEISQKRHKS